MAARRRIRGTELDPEQELGMPGKDSFLFEMIKKNLTLGEEMPID